MSAANLRLQNRAFWIFLLGWALILFLNKWVGAPSCWFFSDARGEYSLSENLSALSYLAAAVLLFRGRYKVASAFTAWLLLEEINYGQIFLNRSPTNYYFDEDQLSLHTSFLRPVSLGMPFDLAGLASFGLHLAIVTIVPVVLARRFKVKAPLYVLALPLALSAFACAGRYYGFLVPWGCGRDSADEITETIQATSTLYFAFLLLQNRPAKI